MVKAQFSFCLVNKIPADKGETKRDISATKWEGMHKNLFSEVMQKWRATKRNRKTTDDPDGRIEVTSSNKNSDLSC